VKTIPAGVTELPFVCTQHGDDMPGTLVLQAVKRKVRSTAAATVTINGLRLPNRWDPDSVTVKAGDVVEWHAAAGTHGVIFNDWNVAQLALDVDTTASLAIGPQTGFPAPAQGTVAKTAPPDTLLVRATVKTIPAGVTELPFVCTQHGDDMPGTLVLQAATKKPERTHAVRSGENPRDVVPISLANVLSVSQRTSPESSMQLPAEDGFLNWDEAQDTKLLDKNGSTRSLREYSGRPHIVVLINGAFCKHCMAQLAELHQQLEVFSVSIVVVTPINDLEDLADVPFDVFADPELNLFKSLQAFRDEPLHGTFVLNSRDDIVLKDIGSEPYTDFAEIKKALKDSLR
jgi:peroxiredoxin/plastocyanin